MRIKLYFDEDAMRSGIVRGLQARGVDVVTAMDAHLMGRPDPEHLAFATIQERVLFTFNRSDFARFHTETLRSGQHHTGIVVANQAETGLIVRCLLNLVALCSAEEMHDWLEYLSNWR